MQFSLRSQECYTIKYRGLHYKIFEDLIFREMVSNTYVFSRGLFSCKIGYAPVIINKS